MTRRHRPTQVRIARAKELSMMGKNNSEIARELGVNRITVSKYLKELDEVIEEKDRNLAEIFSEAVPKAAMGMLRDLDSEDAKIRMEAQKYWLAVAERASVIRRVFGPIMAADQEEEEPDYPGLKNPGVRKAIIANVAKAEGLEVIEVEPSDD